MFWPFVLPIQLTVLIIGGLVVVSTLAAPLVKWPRLPTFAFTALMGLLAFVPSCTALKLVLDAKRFGVFRYETVGEIDDFRVERYLPPTARDLVIEKLAQGIGFRAKYRISKTELVTYIDGRWDEYGRQSAISRQELRSAFTMPEKRFQEFEDDLGWPPLQNPVTYHGPVEDDGGGFTVWFDSDAEIAYHPARYW